MQPGDVLLAHHPAIHYPDPTRQAEALLHDAHNFLDGRDIHPVAVKDLVGKRHALSSHHHRDAHLLAVRPMVTTVAALRLGIPLREPLEERARDIVEKKVIVEVEELAQTLL